ncbi:MAG: DUF58 domain-containing protein [Chloroflexota bacterium]
MMPRFLLLSLLIYGLVLAGLAGLNRGLLTLAIPLLVYLAAGLLSRPDRLRLTARRTQSAGFVYPGQPVEIKVTITNEGPSLAAVTLSDLLPPAATLVNGETRLLTSLPSGAAVELSYTLAGERGRYAFTGVQVTAAGRLGLFEKQDLLPAAGQFLVLPEVTRLRRAEIRPRQTRVYAGQIPARQGGPGVEFFGVRAYQPGDSLRWVNSRASARYPETLFINEFEQERVADVGLILDARHQSDARCAGRSLFEYGIRATASLADTFLSAGNRVGLFIYGAYLDWTLPGYGKVQRQRILQALARAELGEGEVFGTLEHLPTRLFPARSQLVLVSPLLKDDPKMLIPLRAHGYRLLVISPDPVAFERQGLPPSREAALATRLARLERSLLLAKLRQADIRVVNWAVDTPLPEAAQAALSRFRRL